MIVNLSLWKVQPNKMTAKEFTLQFNQLNSALFAFALNLTKDHEAARDLVQETAFKAYKYRKNYQPQTNLRAWLMTIMRNAFINEYRKRKRRQTFNDFTSNDYLLDSGGKVVNNMGESSLTATEIQVQVDALDDSLKMPFLLHLQGFKYEEIAEQLQLPLGTVKSRIFFARKRLQKAIRQIYQVNDLVDILD